MLARNHGLCPLDSAVTPAVLTSLEDLGFAHVLERHEPSPAFAAWAARAVPGAYLVVVPDHILAAQAIALPGGGTAVRVADNGEFCTPGPAPPGTPAPGAAGAREHPLRALRRGTGTGPGAIMARP